MIKEKGYFEVLKLAPKYADKNYHFHFAGGWQKGEDEKEFFEYIKSNDLEEIITFHGFVNGPRKKELFEKCQLLVFPTRYHFESFGLNIENAESQKFSARYVAGTTDGICPI